MNRRDQLAASIALEISRYSSHQPAEQRKSNHIRLHGLSICIETPKGHRRRPDWPEMPADYGYIKRTEGADGDAVDVFIGPHQKSEMVYVIDQCSKDGTFDEHKVMLGYTNYNKAVDAYKAAYTKGWKVGKVTAMTIEQFKNWLKDGNKNTKIQHQVSRYAFDMFDDSGKPRLRPTLIGTGSYAPVPQTWALNTGSPHVMSHQSQMPQDGVKQPWHMSINEFSEHHAKNPGMINGGLSPEDGLQAHEFMKKNFGPETYRVFKFTDRARKQHLYNIAHAMRTGQPVHPDAIADYPRDIIRQSNPVGGNVLADQMFQGLPHHFENHNQHHADRNWRPPQNRQGGSGEVTPYSASSAIPPIADGQTRLTHFFANPNLKKKFLSGEPFQYHRQGVIDLTTDSFSNNDDVQSLLETGKVGALDRAPFGPHVLIMDVPHTEHRLHNHPQWADGQLHNGHIAGVYDRDSGQFHSNPAYGTAPQYKPTYKQLPSQNRPGDTLQSHSFNTPIPQPSTHQTVKPDDVFSMKNTSSVHRYSEHPDFVANLTDEQHKGIGESFREGNASPGGYFHPQIKTLSNHGVHKDQMLTGDDQNMILFHAGVLGHDAIGKHLYGEARESSLDGSQPEMRAGDFNFRLASALNKHGSAVKKAEGEKRATGAKVISFKRSDGQRLLLHPAVRSDRTSDWQLSHIGSDGRPSGHSNPESFQHGLHQALGVYHHPYYNHHGFDIEWTDRDGTKAPYQLRADVDRYAEFQQLGLFDDLPSGSHFEEKKHPRWKAGDQAHHGGQFAPKSNLQPKAHQPNLFETHGNPDQKWLFGDEGVHGDMVLTPSEPEPIQQPAPAPQPQSQGIIPPPSSIPNEQAQPGQQLGLFGDAPLPKALPPKLDFGNQPKPKQGNLFDTTGNATQMDLFGDGVMSDDLVYKPDNPGMGIPKKTSGLGGFMRGESQTLPKPQAKTPQAASFVDEPKEPFEAGRSAVNPVARPEDPDHADHHLSLAESPKADDKDDRFTKELNDPRTRNYLLSQARKMTKDADEAEDIVQNAMMRAFQSRKSYDPSRPFLGWIHTILNRQSINANRDKKAKKRGGELSIESLDAPLDSNDAVNRHDIIGSNARIHKPDVNPEEIEAVDKALLKLPEKHRAVIALFREGHNYREIGQKLGISGAYAGRLRDEAVDMLQGIVGRANYVLNALIERYCRERDAEYYAMCLRVYRYSVFGEIDRYEFTEEDQPKAESGNSEGGGFSTKMHNGTAIPERPESISENHFLHLKSVAKNPGTFGIASKLANAARGLRAIGNAAQAKHDAGQSSESPGGSPYDHVDWGKVQGHLDELNQLHKQSLADGHNVANIANYNGVIPKWLIPRLASGRKFVDPSMLGSKWTKDTPSPMQAPKDPEHGFQTGWNSKWQPGNEHRGYNLADEAKQAALNHSQKKPGMQFAIAQHPEGLWYVAHREMQKPPVSQSQSPQAVSQLDAKPQQSAPQPKQVQGELVGNDNHLKIYKDGKWKHATVTAANEGGTGWRVKHVKVTDPETGMYEHVPFPVDAATGYGSYEQARDEVFSVLNKKYGNPPASIGQNEGQPKNRLPGSASQPEPRALSQPQPQQQSQPQPQQPRSRFMGDGRVFNAGMNRGSIGFENELHRDLYDLGARIRNNNNRNNHFNPQEKKQTESLERRISSHPEIQRLLQSGQLDPNGLRNLAINTHEYAKEQMRGLKEGEHRQPKMLPMMKPDQQQPSPQQPPQPQSLDDKILQHLEKNPNTDIHALGDAVGVKPSGYGQAWDSSELNKSLRRLRDAGKIQSPQDKPGSWGAPRFSLAQQSQPASAPPQPGQASSPKATGPHPLDEYGEDATPEIKAEWDRLDQAVKAIPFSIKDGFRSDQERQQWRGLAAQQDAIISRLGVAKEEKARAKESEIAKQPNKDNDGKQTSGFFDGQDTFEPAGEDPHRIDFNKFEKQPQSSANQDFQIQSEKPPYQGNPVDGFPTEDDRWAWEAEQERLADEEYRRSLVDPSSPNYDATKDPNHPSYDSIANAPSSSDKPHERTLEAPRGYTKTQFKNVTSAISDMLSRGRYGVALSDQDIHEIGHIAASLHDLESEHIARKKGLLEALVGEKSERRFKEVRRRLLSAHTANKNAIEQNNLIPENEKASMIKKAEEEYKDNLEKELKLASNKSQSAVNIKLTAMRQIARGDYDPVSAAKASPMFADWDRRAESLSNQFPDVLQGSNLTPVDQKLWEILQQPHPKTVPLRHHEDILSQAINHFIDGINERKSSSKNLDHVPFSAYLNAQIQRYSARLSLQNSLEKSLQKFCNKAS